MWKVIYHPLVEKDLKTLGHVEAKRILRAIDERIVNGEPHKVGKTLSHDLAGCRRLRVGETRIIYKIYDEVITVLIVAVGPRKDDEVYSRASGRSI